MKKRKREKRERKREEEITIHGMLSTRKLVNMYIVSTASERVSGKWARISFPSSSLLIHWHPLLLVLLLHQLQSIDKKVGKTKSGKRKEQ